MNSSAESVFRRSRWPVVVAAIAGAALLVHVPACGPPCKTCPSSSLSAPTTCVGAEATTNDLPTNDLPTNGLSTASLEANEILLQRLANMALSEQVLTASSALGEALKEAYAGDLVQYIASCALDPCEHVKIPHGADLAHLRRRFPDGFPGGLGLCSGTYNAWAASHGKPAEQSWRTHAPSQACLERVSACMIARVNAVEARVPISMRGDGLRLLDKVPVQTKYRENHGTPIQSFKPCDRMCLWGDRERRNCDWEPRYVGQCVRGPTSQPPRRARLAITSGTAVRVRICKGLHGCDDVAPALGAGAATEPVFAHGRLVEFPPHYGGQRIAHQRTGRTVEFECPDNGPLVPGTQIRTGYYSVMVGSLVPGAPIAASTDVTLAGPGGPHDRYPASEAQVFTYREGGFYGSIFPPPKSTWPAGPASGFPRPPTSNQYACASEIWNPQNALFESRFCAGPLELVPTPSCFANTPGQCDLPAGQPLCSRPAASPIVYDDCKGGVSGATKLIFRHPYTVYLSHPCDLFASDEECRPHLAPGITEEIAVRTLAHQPTQHKR